MNKTQFTPLRTGVFGGGSWGTALAHVLAEAGHRVTLFVRHESVANSINAEHKNPKYLTQYPIHPNVKATTKHTELQDYDFFVLAIPAQNLRSFLTTIGQSLPHECILVNSAKGIESSTGKPMQEVVQEELAQLSPLYATISGPSFADEVMQSMPTAVVLGCEDQKLGERLRSIFSTPYFRCYSSTDVLGVELGGALKNIMAIAVGLCDGLGFGQNTRAALLTRALAEMSRLGLAAGAQAKTFMGLSGLGDLVLTANGNLSRNRQVGLRLGQGEKLSHIIESLGMVAEGVKTTEAVYNLTKKYNVSAPISTAIYDILYTNLSPQECAKQLMQRSLRDE